MRILRLPLLAGLACGCAAQQPVWTPLGPAAIPGASGTSGSGKIQTLAIYGANPRIMYAGAGIGSGAQAPDTAGGVFKTTDGGAHWVAMNNSLTDYYANAIWVDQTNPDNVLVGSQIGGLFRSTDGGQSWSMTGTPPPTGPDPGAPSSNLPQNVGATTDIATLGSQVLAATYGGVASSTNGGATWSLSFKTAAPVTTLSVQAGAVAIGTQIGNVLYQAPGASTFTVSYTGGIPVSSVAIDPAAPTTVYAALNQGNSTLAITSDLKTWTKIAPPSPAQAVAVSATTHIIYLGTAVGLFSSGDGGNTWTEVPGAAWNIRRIYAPDDTTVIVGSDEGAYETTTGGKQWTSLTGGISDAVSTGVSAFGSVLLTAAEGFAPPVSYDGGGTWTQGVASGQSGSVLINPGNPAYCYVYTFSGFEASADGCQTFTQPKGIGGSPFYNGQAGADILAVDFSAPQKVYAASSKGVYASSDYGATMALTSWGLTNTTAIAVNPADGNTILVGTNAGLSRTADGGQTWSSVSIPGSGYPTTIAFSPKDPTIVLVGLSNSSNAGGGVIRSSNSGVSFVLSNNGLPTQNEGYAPGAPQSSVRISPNGVAALATNVGVYISADTGNTWQNVTPFGIARFYSDVAWDGPYNLYTASYGGGILFTQPFGPSPVSLQANTQPVNATSAYKSPAFTAAQLALTTSTGDSLQYFALVHMNSGSGWLAVPSVPATAPGSLSVILNPAGLAPGMYTGQITIVCSGANNGPLTVPVTLTVTPVLLQTDTPSVSVSVVVGASAVTTTQAALTASTGAALPWSAAVQVNSGSGWLAVSSAAGTTPGGVSILVNPAGLNPGIYTGQVTITSPGANNSPLPIPVTLTVNPPAGSGPLIFTGGIVPVSSTAGTISPQAWVAVYGLNLAPATTFWNNDFPTKLGGVSVSIDGKPAYLWYVSPTQINLQVPDDRFTGPVPVVVTTPSGSATAMVNLAMVSPSLLLFDARYPAAVIPVSDGSGAYGGGTYDELGPAGHFTFTTRPVKVGEVLVLFATGFGPVMGSVAGKPFSGATPLGQESVLVLVNNVIAPVQFVGLVGAGLYQINIVVPNVPGGDQLLRVNVGGSDAQSGIYITVR